MSELESRLENLQSIYDDLNEQAQEVKDEMENFLVEDYIDEYYFKEILNEDTVNVYGMRMEVGEVLYKMDPVAFNEAYNNFLDTVDVTDIEEYNDLEAQFEELEGQLDEIASDIEQVEDWIAEEEAAEV